MSAEVEALKTLNAKLRAELERTLNALEEMLTVEPDEPTYQSSFDAAEEQLTSGRKLLGIET